MRPLTNGRNDWERVSMHRVVTLNTLCSIASIYFATQHRRFFSEPPTFFEENNVLWNLWTTLCFARYCTTFSQVRWANLQSTSVKFLQDAVCQKSLVQCKLWLPSNSLHGTNDQISNYLLHECVGIIVFGEFLSIKKSESMFSATVVWVNFWYRKTNMFCHYCKCT